MVAMSIPGLQPIAKACAYALQWLAALVGGNYGVAIILLTILMRIVLLPLSIKQTKSMIAMQKLQPQLKEIQKKFKDDREKMGQEMMKLYKENKVSPLGGCLPLLLQLPIIFAVFEVLRSLSTASTYQYIFLAHQTKAQFSANLMFLGMNITYTGSKLWSGGDYVQVVVLVLLTVVTGYVTAKMMTTDPKQAKMMALMPLMMGVFAWILPAGVTIYIIVTNIFTLVQQYIQLEHEGFYDDKLAELRKMGDGAKWYQKLYLKTMETGTGMLVAVHLRPKPKPRASGKKKTDKGEVKSSGSGPAVSKEESKKGKPPSGKDKQGTKAGAKPQGLQTKGKNAAAEAKSGGVKSSGKTPQKKYPAKKKSSGKK
jgi:YidC/Oxa1 family membrane protein insertase